MNDTLAVTPKAYDLT